MSLYNQELPEEDFLGEIKTELKIIDLELGELAATNTEISENQALRHEVANIRNIARWTAIAIEEKMMDENKLEKIATDIKVRAFKFLPNLK